MGNTTTKKQKPHNLVRELYEIDTKYILTTHDVYWPTILMAAKIPLPKTIFSHVWWLM